MFGRGCDPERLRDVLWNLAALSPPESQTNRSVSPPPRPTSPQTVDAMLKSRAPSRVNKKKEEQEVEVETSGSQTSKGSGTLESSQVAGANVDNLAKDTEDSAEGESLSQSILQGWETDKGRIPRLGGIWSSSHGFISRCRRDDPDL